MLDRLFTRKRIVKILKGFFWLVFVEARVGVVEFSMASSR